MQRGKIWTRQQQIKKELRMAKRYKRKVERNRSIEKLAKRVGNEIKNIGDYMTSTIDEIARRVGMVMQLQELLIDQTGWTPDQVQEKLKVKREEAAAREKVEAEKREAKRLEAEAVKDKERFDALSPDEQAAELAKKALDAEIAAHNKAVDDAKQVVPA
jgi:hypothetical protein